MAKKHGGPHHNRQLTTSYEGPNWSLNARWGAPNGVPPTISPIQGEATRWQRQKRLPRQGILNPKAIRRTYWRTHNTYNHRAVIRASKKYIYHVNRRVQYKSREKMCKDPNVVPNNTVNTSDHIRTRSEIKLLNRGSSFVPKSSEIHLDNIISEFDQLVRK